MTLTDKVRSFQLSGKKLVILIAGDLMIDHYIWGAASRLSPEAPVPIVNVKNETTTLGGAGNLTQNLVSLGAKVIVGGVVGGDAAGKQLQEILQEEGIGTENIVVDNNRATTVKTRVLAGTQQLVRIDREHTYHLEQGLQDILIQKITAKIDEADIVVLSDYNKGLLSPGFIAAIINVATVKNKKVIVDPKGLDYAKYKNAYIIKPNKKEIAEAAKKENIKNIDELVEASATIFEITNAEYLVVTLSEEGMVIITRNGYKLLPVKATEVFDVTGAGDTVLAAMAYFIAAGLSIEEACELANHAAAIVVRHLGSATTTIAEILKDINA